MLYFGVISYNDSYKDIDGGNRRDNMVLATLVVESDNADTALRRIIDKLIILCDEDERYCGVHDFYLDDLIEVSQLDFSAKEIAWISILPFGDTFAQMRFLEDEDPSLRHYALRKSKVHESIYKSDFAMNAELVPIEEISEKDEDDDVPLISIDRDRRLIKPLYKELCKRKLQGLLPEFKDLSDGDLYELYVVEGCLSTEIADLFGIKRSKVDYRRRKIGATINEEVTYDLLRSFEIIDSIPYEKPYKAD